MLQKYNFFLNLTRISRIFYTKLRLKSVESLHKLRLKSVNCTISCGNFNISKVTFADFLLTTMKTIIWNKNYRKLSQKLDKISKIKWGNSLTGEKTKLSIKKTIKIDLERQPRQFSLETIYELTLILY